LVHKMRCHCDASLWQHNTAIKNRHSSNGLESHDALILEVSNILKPHVVSAKLLPTKQGLSGNDPSTRGSWYTCSWKFGESREPRNDDSSFRLDKLDASYPDVCCSNNYKTNTITNPSMVTTYKPIP
jgi:hypothetical protein